MIVLNYTKRLRKAAKNYGPRLRNDLAKIAEQMEDAANRSGENDALDFGGQQVPQLRELISGLDRPKRLNEGNLGTGKKTAAATINPSDEEMANGHPKLHSPTAFCYRRCRFPLIVVSLSHRDYRKHRPQTAGVNETRDRDSFVNSEFPVEVCMTTNKANKCAHPNCSCATEPGKRYCSPQCEAMEKTPDLDCKFGHPGCFGRVS